MIRQLLSYIAATALVTSPLLMRPAESQTQQTLATVTTEQSAPRRLKLNLTISEPEDLKVVEGQQVSVGQTLTDRTKERERLTAQKEQLEIALERLSVEPPKITPPPPPPPVAKLPKADYSQQMSDIALAENTLESKRLAVKIGREKVEQIQQLRVPDVVLEHESSLLALQIREQERAALELDAKKSTLKASRSDRAYTEYLHRLELERRAIEHAQQVAEYERQLVIMANQERQREYQKATVQTQISNVENALAQISQVRSPYEGEIKKIRWLPGNDNALAVQLVIVPEGQRPAASSTLPGVRLPGNPNENEVSPLPGVEQKLPGNPDENSDRSFS